MITETAPADENGQSVWELTDIDCGGVGFTRNGNSIELTVTDAVITCTFTDEVTRAEIQGIKTVVGDTSSWVRPAQFHITCPDIQLDIDIEPPVGPGGPGTYIIGQGSIPPATCTISEIDTGSDGSVFVTMTMTNHGVPIAFGSTSLTFTSHAGDDLVLSVTNVFPAPDTGSARPRPGHDDNDRGRQHHDDDSRRPRRRRFLAAGRRQCRAAGQRPSRAAEGPQRLGLPRRPRLSSR